MKVIKINNKDYVLKFTSQTISELNAKGITLVSLSNDMQSMKVSSLYEAFACGLKAMQHDIDLEKAYRVIDEYFENEENDIESFFELVLEEYSKSMGLGKTFKKVMQEQKMKEQKPKTE